MATMFTSTASSINKMSALVSGAGTDAAIYDDPQDADILTLLDSRYDADKSQALKRLIALMAQGQDVANFFPQVVKSVASQSLEVKKLVYIYLVHYADKRPNEALLSINSFQRDLSDINPVVRAWALRAMSGIKVRAVIPLVIMAANKCARDPSPYVRRCAANAVSKIHSMGGDEQHNDALVELVSILLNDSCAGVVGAAAAAFSAVCPELNSEVRTGFKKLCGHLSESDVWGQTALMDVLMRYIAAKHGVARTVVDCEATTLTLKVDSEDFLAPDMWELRLLLSSTSPLLRSQNSAVVVQAAVVHWFFSPSKDLINLVKPLLFLLRSSYDSHHVVLANILSFSKRMPSLFEPYYEDFFVRSSDSQGVHALKLDILTNIVTDSSINQILQELEAYLQSPDSRFSSSVVNAIGRCAIRLSSAAVVCTKGLLRLAASKHTSGRGDIAVQAVLALRAIVQKHPEEQDQVMVHLLHNLKSITEPTAREVVIWMIGEHGLSSPIVSKAIPVVLQHLAKTFVSEGDGTKLQILSCLSKVIMTSQLNSSSRNVLLVLQYVLNLASCDLSYDIRDRARMLRVLLSCHLQDTRERDNVVEVDATTAEILGALVVGDKQQTTCVGEIARSMLLTQKSVPVLPALSFENFSFLPGSMSHVVQHMSPGYRPLPTKAGERPHDTEKSSDSAEETGSGKLISTSDEEGSVYSDEETPGSGLSQDEDESDAGRKSPESTGGNLISLSDNESLLNDNHQDLRASADLESWLGPQESSVSNIVPSWEPKKILTLDFTYGEGLEVHHCFMRQASIYSPNMVCVRFFFHNRASEPLTEISLGDQGASEQQPGFECGTAMVIPPQSIVTLGPGERTECNAHVDFRHNLNPIKMWLYCNGKKFPLKISPEAGALLRPREMSLERYLAVESGILGMHRSSRRISLKSSPVEDTSKVCRQLCKGIISGANVALVPASSSRAELRFSGETLTGSLVCLISVSLEAASMEGTLLVSCEDTLFGLALLNQLDKYIGEQLQNK